MKRRNLSMAAAGLLFPVLTLFAQITTIEGTVKGVDGKPVPDKTPIQIVRTDIKGNYPTKTDKKGHYIYTGLPIGTYSVTVMLDGKPIDSQSNIRTSPGDSKVVDFDLKTTAASKANQQAELQKAMQTGQMSKELERSLTPEQKKQVEEQMKKQEAEMKKNKELNDAYNTGVAALDNKQYDQAIESLTKAGEVGPNQVAVWAHLGDAYMGRAVTKNGAEKDADLAKCIESYNKAIALKPDDAAIHNNYGRALAAAGKLPDALGEMQKAAQLDPTGASRYYFNLGALLTNAGKVDEASEAFKKAVDAAPDDPKNAESYYQYGVSLMGKASITADGKVTPAAGTLEAFEKYLQLAPQGPNAANAQSMIATLGGSVQTSYANPDAKKAPPKKKK